MEFVLFEKLSDLSGVELVMLLSAVVLSAILIFAALRYRKADHTAPQNRTRALVYGALCVALSFVLLCHNVAQNRMTYFLTSLKHIKPIRGSS